MPSRGGSGSRHFAADPTRASADGTIHLSHRDQLVPVVSSSVPPHAAGAVAVLEDCDLVPRMIHVVGS